MNYTYYLSDVFTDRLFGGNQLAVFPDAQGIPPAVMQQIARELNLSETVFVLPPEDAKHAAKLRIFTPGAELPFAGHPTVGTACTLLQLGRLGATGKAAVIFEEGVGPIPVRVRNDDGRWFAEFRAAQLPEIRSDVPDAQTIADLLSIDVADLSTDMQPAAVSCGVPFIFIPIRSGAAMARVKLDLNVWDREIAGTWAPHVYVLTRDVEFAGSSIRARMFAPAFGIPEDPATGGAATALAGFLAQYEEATRTWRIEQGIEMGRPSFIDLEIEREAGHISSITVFGQTVMVGNGSIAIDIA